MGVKTPTACRAEQSEKLAFFLIFFPLEHLFLHGGKNAAADPALSPLIDAYDVERPRCRRHGRAWGPGAAGCPRRRAD